MLISGPQVKLRSTLSAIRTFYDVDGTQSGASLFILESATLLFAAPFLLFPSLFPLATAVGLSLLALVGVVRIAAGRHPLLATPLNMALLPFTLAIGVGILVSADPDLTLPKATGLLLGLATWRYLVLYVSHRRHFYLAFGLFVCLGLGMIGLGVLSVNWLDKVPGLQALLQYLPGRLLTLPGSPESGVHSNQLAGTLLLFVPLSIAGLIWWGASKPRRGRWVLAGVVVAAVGVIGLLLLSQSRGGWAGALAGVIALVWLWSATQTDAAWWRRPVLWGLPVLLLAAAAAAATFVERDQLQTFLLDPPDQTVVGSLSSLSFRQEVWHWAITAAHDFAFTGCGLGAFRAVAFRLYPLAVPPTYDIAHAHNIFLQTALDVGIPGLIAYVALLLVVGWMGWQVARRDGQLRPFVLGLLAGFVALHTYGLLDALALGSKPGLLFWIAAGLLTAAFNLPPTITADKMNTR